MITRETFPSMNTPWDAFNLMEFNWKPKELWTTVGDDMQYKIVVDDENHTINCCFESSNGMRDWINNFMFRPVQVGDAGTLEEVGGTETLYTDAVPLYKNAKNLFHVHRGFFSVWQSGHRQIMSAVIAAYNANINSRPTARGNRPYNIIFWGFSMGGALAQLAAENFHFETGVRPYCVIFGSPRVAWGEHSRVHLADAMLLINWRNINDVITHVPFEAMGFYHASDSRVMTSQNILRKINVKAQHLIYRHREVYPING